MIAGKIWKPFSLAIIMLLAGIQSGAQSTNADKQELYKLLQQRREKFDAYAASIEKHSGIFGNKTKKDMKQSNQVLTAIVQTDNQIISLLNRTVDFKNYEKINLNYDTQAQQEKANKLIHSVDTLQKQLQVVKYQNRSLISEHQRTQVILFFAVTCSICLLVILLYKLKK